MTEHETELPALIVIAKAPVPGRSKTRLTPPCTQEQAADIARAALEDTLEAALATPASEYVLALDGERDDWLPDGFTVIPQRGDGLDERLAAAFEDAPTPALLIGMDTPQVTPEALRDAIEQLHEGSPVFGAALDGGYWAIGLRASRPGLFLGVPMSTDATADAQRERLLRDGIVPSELPVLRDVDTFADARLVAADAPDTRFADAVERATEPPVRTRWLRMAVALSAWVGLFVAAWLWGNVINDARGRATDMLVQAPPFTGHYRFGLQPGILVALAFGALVVGFGPWVAHRVGWRTLLWVTMLASAAWILALVLGDPVKHLSSPLKHRTEYLRGIPFIGDDLGEYLRGFTDRIHDYPSHVRSHPPGLVSFLWTLRQIGLGAAEVAAGLFVLGGAAAAPAVMLATKDVAGERRARAIAPFLVLAPAAVFMGTTADALFAGVGAWVVAFLVLATAPSRTVRRRAGLAFAGGLVLGVGIFLSYGLALVMMIPIVVAWKRKVFLPLFLAAAPVVLITGMWMLAGFWWLDGLSATREQYARGISQDRPYVYFLVANLAALSVAVGPAAIAGATRLRGRAWWLVGGAALAVSLANLSGMSKAEVERIWLPFGVWLLIACAPLVRDRWHGRGWLALQGTLALVVTVGLDSPW